MMCNPNDGALQTVQALGLALVQRGNMGGRTQLTETGHTLRAYCDKVLAVASEAAQVRWLIQTKHRCWVLWCLAQCCTGIHADPNLVGLLRQSAGCGLQGCAGEVVGRAQPQARPPFAAVRRCGLARCSAAISADSDLASLPVLAGAGKAGQVLSRACRSLLSTGHHLIALHVQCPHPLFQEPSWQLPAQPPQIPYHKDPQPHT